MDNEERTSKDRGNGVLIIDHCLHTVKGKKNETYTIRKLRTRGGWKHNLEAVSDIELSNASIQEKFKSIYGAPTDSHHGTCYSSADEICYGNLNSKINN
jgi:hypothetical protein